LSTAVLHNQFVATADVISGVLGTSLPPSLADLSLQIVIPDFAGVLELPLTDIGGGMASGKVLLKASIDVDSTIVLLLTGELVEQDDKFHVRQVNLNTETTTKKAQTDFVLTTIRAALSLANQVQLRMTEIGLDLELRFSEPLIEISNMLRRRLIAYRILVIERATGHRFKLPLDITGLEVEEIALIYHAITQRAFQWPFESLTVFMPATIEWAERLEHANQSSDFSLGPDPQTKNLFGHVIPLGLGLVTVVDKIIDDFDGVVRELSKNDGHQVEVKIRSLTGQCRYDFPEAPRLPHRPWDERIQMLVDLDAPLDAALVGRYNALAASTLEGLSEEEKAALTARPELDEDAFAIDR
jgi:hypothetical protein